MAFEAYLLAHTQLHLGELQPSIMDLEYSDERCVGKSSLMGIMQGIVSYSYICVRVRDFRSIAKKKKGTRQQVDVRYNQKKGDTNSTNTL